MKKVFAFFGRKLTNEDFLEAVRETTEHLKNRSSLMFKLLFPFVMLYMVFLGCRKIPVYERQMFVDKEINFQVPASRVPLKEKMRAMFREMGRHFPMMQVHGNSSFGSSIKSLLLMKTLKSAGSGDDNEVLSDLNLLMSHCNDVVSAEVPNMLREIAQAVEDREAFAAMTDEAALALLKRGKREVKASKLFTEFLEKHGHRGYREFDPYHQPWGKQPLPCVQVVKSMMRAGSNLEAKPEVPIDVILGQLKTPLSPTRRAIVKYWLLPWVRDAVGFREHTKSLLVKFQDLTREAMWYIAGEMVAAGLLPEAELYFFLRLDELQRLLSGERCPTLVMKAKQRRRLYPTMNKLKFEEFVKGMRMAPKVSVLRFDFVELLSNIFFSSSSATKSRGDHRGRRRRLPERHRRHRRFGEGPRLRRRDHRRGGEHPTRGHPAHLLHRHWLVAVLSPNQRHRHRDRRHNQPRRGHRPGVRPALSDCRRGRLRPFSNGRHRLPRHEDGHHCEGEVRRGGGGGKEEEVKKKLFQVFSKVDFSIS